MLRTHTCGELRLVHQGQEVTLCGWVQTVRDKGHLLWIDLRDRYGITQLVLEQGTAHSILFDQARLLNREYVVRVKGTVTQRYSANPCLATGDIELQLTFLQVLSEAELPPFLIQDATDGGMELRMKYRYLDLRRGPLQANLQFRHQLTQHIRTYLNKKQFVEIETPMLVKSTPEGARDFIVPAGLASKQLYYALPQSPQILKQLLMIAGMDRYYQLVKCFRNEDLRADRQPEFTQLDCELSFVEQEDVLILFEELMRYLFAVTKHMTLPPFTRMSYADAMQGYGTDKPDLRWGMPFIDFTSLAKGKGFAVFDQADVVLGICLKQGARFNRKQIDDWVNFVKRPNVGAQGLVYVKYGEDGGLSSSVQKWYDQAILQQWLQRANAQTGDLLLILAGLQDTIPHALSLLRLHIGKTCYSHLSKDFAPLWIIDFPLLVWDKEEGRYHAAHHPFTAPKPAHQAWLAANPSQVQAQAYDMVINGIEIGGGSVRMHDRDLQMKMFKLLGFSPSEAQKQFGFLIEALSYGAPPHAGIALGFDRLCMLLAEGTSIRDYMAFPKNNAGRDLMLDAPAGLSVQEYDQLGIS